MLPIIAPSDLPALNSDSDDEAGTIRDFIHSASCIQRSYQTPIKRRAIEDYRQSLSEYGGRLSNDIGQLFATAALPSQQQFSVLIIGSGYGAAICAARLSAHARPGHRIAILERGKEWTPGTFPDTFRDVSSHARQQLFGPRKGTVVNPLGLYQVKVSDQVNTLSASGLGGTSLINANVALKPDPDVFAQSCWPVVLQDRATLDPYFEVAARMLNLAHTQYDLTGKVRVRRLAADKLNPRSGFFDRSPLTVTYDGRFLDSDCRNQFNVIQRPCTLCGDCITGCNIGAKNTLTTNYLPLAKQSGTEMYTQVEVTGIEPAAEGYRVHCVYRDDRSGQADACPLVVSAERVHRHAGSPGAPRFCCNRASTAWNISPALGQRWSFNGDTIGFVIKPNPPAPIGGHGAVSGCWPADRSDRAIFLVLQPA